MDEYAGSRLPDLPNAGYQTPTQRQLSDAIMFLIRGLERDRLLLLEIVLGGKLVWRKRFVAAYRAIRADSEMADAVYGYLELLAGPNPDAQKAILEGQIRQSQRESWDKRLSTLLTHQQDQAALHDAIDRELRKPRRTYSH